MIKAKLVEIVATAFRDACEDGRLGALTASEVPSIYLQRPKLAEHGDLSCSLALQLAPRLKSSPLTIAETLADYIERNEANDRRHIAIFEVARPGFINFTLRAAWPAEVLSSIVRLGPAYGQIQRLAGDGARIFLSMPPTPGKVLGQEQEQEQDQDNLLWRRSRIYGEALARLLKFAGYDLASSQSQEKVEKCLQVLPAGEIWDRPAEGWEILFTQGVKLSPHRLSGYKALQEAIGEDGCHFYMTAERQNTVILNLQQAVAANGENPLFVVQYAYARCCAVMRRALEAYVDSEGLKEALISEKDWLNFLDCCKHSPDLFVPLFDQDPVVSLQQKALISRLEEFPEVVQWAVGDRQPARIAVYAVELANDLQKFYQLCRIINDTEKLSVSKARLGLIFATRQVLSNALGIIGVSTPERM